MNYISHYYFYKQEDPYYNCGLVFPDLLAAYKRTKLNSNLIFNTAAEGNLNAGIQNHFLGDKIFHSSNYFTTQTHGIKLILERSKLDKNKFRFSFLAHIILEMMIDRLLLMNNPNLGISFYESLDRCDDELLVQFAQKNSPVDEGLKIIIQKFKYYRFILNYLEIDKFVYSLGRITGRVGIVFDEDQSHEIIKVMDAIEHYVKESLPDLFSLFQSHEI